MEANRDSALHYLELAEKAILVSDIERALRYINKSTELFPTQKAKDLLERIKDSTYQTNNHHRTHESTSKSHHSKSEETSSSTRQRTNSSSTGDFTSEEAAAVRKIKGCKDLYEILGVSKTASEADLKKAYRKLALQFHPDKCKAPGATDAFKAIGKAFSILSDPKKREQYDEYGHAMEPQYHRGNTSSSRGGGGHTYYYSDDDENFSAEEIFNIFFGYNGPTNRTHRRRQATHTYGSTTRSTQNATHTLAQLLPYLLLFLISILGTFFVSDPQFQLHRSGKYQHLRTTRTLKLEYFVKGDYRAPSSIAELDQLENAVAEEYISELRHQCHREQQYKESLLWRARMMNDNSLYRQAQQQGTPSCTKLNDFLQKYT